MLLNGLRDQCEFEKWIDSDICLELIKEIERLKKENARLENHVKSLEDKNRELGHK